MISLSQIKAMYACYPKAFLAIGLSVLFIFSLSLTYIVFAHFPKANSPQPITTPVSDPKPQDADPELDSEFLLTQSQIPAGRMPEKIFNIALLGHGDAGHSGGSLTDAVMVLQVDTINKRLNFISLPRDIWVALPIAPGNSISYKLNAAYAIGGDDKKFPQKADQFQGDLGPSNLAKHAIETVTGLSIHYFVAVDFFDLVHVIDLLGGVTVNVPQSFEDHYYPVRGRELELCDYSPEEVTALSATMSGFTLEKLFTCRYETIKFTKGPTKMNGETVLKFIRSRHSAVGGSDFDRGLRQQAVLLGVLDQVISWDNLDKSLPIFTKISQSVRTDIDLDIIKAMITSVTDLKPYSTHQIGLSTENVLQNSKSSAGAYILIPKAGEDNWSATHAYVKSALDQ